MKSHSLLLSFSGIDGAGKTTQIDALLRYLDERGNRYQLYRFWDDIVAFSRYREHLSLRVFKGEKGVGSPDRPVARRDKNVTSWYVVALRLFLYLIDALRLSAIVYLRRGKAEYVIFDRYIYDELANLPLQRPPFRVFVRLILRIVPMPDLAFLLDAYPETAVSRKPEYPLDFVQRNRHAYHTIASMAGMIVLAPSCIDETTRSIGEALASVRLAEDRAGSCGAPRVPVEGAKTHAT